MPTEMDSIIPYISQTTKVFLHGSHSFHVAKILSLRIRIPDRKQNMKWATFAQSLLLGVSKNRDPKMDGLWMIWGVPPFRATPKYSVEQMRWDSIQQDRCLGQNW